MLRQFGEGGARWSARRGCMCQEVIKIHSAVKNEKIWRVLLTMETRLEEDNSVPSAPTHVDTICLRDSFLIRSLIRPHARLSASPTP